MDLPEEQMIRMLETNSHPDRYTMTDLFGPVTTNLLETQEWTPIDLQEWTIIRTSSDP